MTKKPPFTVIYEDGNIAAVSKASGIAVSPDRWDPGVVRLDTQVADFIGLERVYTVHRIDKETSGLVVFAKNSGAHKALSAAFEGRKIDKRYIAVACGRPSWKEIVCDLPLVPDGNKRHLTIIDKFRGKKSLTAFRLLACAGNYSILEAQPETGRTHQIRVHLASLGHPVACDEFYGRGKPVFLSSFKRGWRGDPLEERPLLSRLGLHALEIQIPAEIWQLEAETQVQKAPLEPLILRAPLHRDMAALLKQMEKAAGENVDIFAAGHHTE